MNEIFTQPLCVFVPCRCARAIAMSFALASALIPGWLVWKNDAHWIGEIHILPPHFTIPQAIPVMSFYVEACVDVWKLCCSVRAVATL